MFGIVRIFIGVIFFLGMVYLLKKYSKSKQTLHRVILCVLTIALVTLSAFIPFENLFVTFPTPEAAFKYVNFENEDVKLVVPGNESALIVGENRGTNTYLIIPKDENGWKIGLGSNTKRVVYKVTNNIIVTVYQYKNTDDYYITLFSLGTSGDVAQVADNRGSKFIPFKQDNTEFAESSYMFSAYVSKFDNRYRLIVNGTELDLN